MLLHHSDVYYVRAGLMADKWLLLEGSAPPEVKEVIPNMPLKDLANLLREEGLLKYHEYGIPRWYARKWFNEGLSKKKAVELVQRIRRRTA